MKKLLFINACERGQNSRTLSLCNYALETLKQKYDIEEINLSTENIKPLDNERLEKRTELIKKGNFDDEMFRFANQFKNADAVMVGAPYWDMSFPSIFRVYVENISVCGINFEYNDIGIPVGLSKVQQLIYITTSGGIIGENNFGYDYFKTISNLFGVYNTNEITAEKLDIIGVDVETQLEYARKDIDELLLRI